MTMTVVVLRNGHPRSRGFLASCLCEVAPAIYTGDLSKRVRERVLDVMERWHRLGGDESLVMIWRDKTHPGGQRLVTIGTGPHELVPWDGTLLVRRELTAAETASLKSE